MNAPSIDHLKSIVSDDLHKSFDRAPKKSIVDAAISRVVDKMVADGQAHLMSDEEERLLKSFRRFKVSCKPGSVFKWQTHPEAGVIVVQETSLVADPQEVS